MARYVKDNRLDDGFVVEARTPPFVQVQIRRLYLQGRSYTQIEQIAGVSRATVARFLAPITRGREVEPWPVKRKEVAT